MQPRIALIDQMRGLAALSVAWFHLTNTYGESWVRALGAYGWLGVEVFFVISGFVIPYSIWTSRELYRLKAYPAFIAKRLMRLEPPYLLSIALVLVLWHASALMPMFQGIPPATEIGQIAAHLFYLTTDGL